MPGIKLLETPSPKWKMALPILGLAACAALSTHSLAAHAAPAGKGIHAHGHSREDAYALVRETDHGTNMSGDSADWREIDAVKRKVQGEFLWFRDGGKTWVVQDAGILSRANAAWAPVDKLGKQMDAYGQQMDGHGKNMEALGREMEQAAAKATAHLQDGRSTRDFERKMEELGNRMARLGERLNESGEEAERNDIQEQMRQVGAQMQALGHDFGVERESAARKQARAAMKDLGRKMHEASLPMNELGKQMGALGKQMERESHAADKIVRQLIREAREKGLAKPAPGSA